MRVFAAIRLFMPRHTFAFVALALVLAILGVLGYKLSPLRVARADALLPPTSCNPAETPCSAALPDGGRVVLSAAPRPIRPLQPLRLYVHLIGTQAETVEIDFDGVDMRMGLNRVRLARQSGVDGLYAGQGMLPVCVSGDMRWSATVLVATANGRVAAPFHFNVPAH